MAKNLEIVPFGKYKGQPVEALAQDKEYCEWLVAQDWFRAKFTAIHTLIINNFGEPDESPEHNQLQARFTDEEFRRKFIWHVDSIGIVQAFRRRRQECLENWKKWCQDRQYLLTIECERLTKLMTDLEEYGPDPHPDNDPNGWKYRNAQYEIPRLHERIPAYQKTLDETKALLPGLEAISEPDARNVSSEARFEVGGTDVVLDYTVSGLHPGQSFEDTDRKEYGYYRNTLCVECKPALSDDYPAVLRQMIANDGNSHRSVLLVGDGGYTGRGATIEQVGAIFKSRRIRVVFLADL